MCRSIYRMELVCAVGGPFSALFFGVGYLCPLAVKYGLDRPGGQILCMQLFNSFVLSVFRFGRWLLPHVSSSIFPRTNHRAGCLRIHRDLTITFHPTCMHVCLSSAVTRWSIPACAFFDHPLMYVLYACVYGHVYLCSHVSV